MTKFEVIAEYPFSPYRIGDVLKQYYYEHSETNMYLYTLDLKEPINGHPIKSNIVENMLHIFKEIIE